VGKLGWLKAASASLTLPTNKRASSSWSFLGVLRISTHHNNQTPRLYLERGVSIYGDSSMKEFEGVVDRWIEDGRYGFITYRNSGAESRVFFPAANIRKDVLGRTGHSSFEGALVRFSVEASTYEGKEQQSIACDIHAVFEEPLTTSINEHREVSQVVKIHPGKCSAWLRREDGSHIFFHRNCVTPEFLDRFAELRVDDYVYHGVECNESGSWAAAHSELFSREENQRLQRGESLTDPEPSIEPAVVPEPEFETVLAPATRSKPLIQLIVEKRSANGPGWGGPTKS
jgi:hypothetical protein